MVSIEKMFVLIGQWRNPQMSPRPHAAETQAIQYTQGSKSPCDEVCK